MAESNQARPSSPHTEQVYRRPLIIERPDLQTISQRWGYRSITVLFWIFWLYLFMPLLSVVAWVAGLSLVYKLMIQNLELVDLWVLVRAYSIGIGLLTGTYLAWAVYSFLRFRHLERRKLAAAVTTDILARSHNLTGAEVRSLRRAQKTTLSPEQLKRMFDPAKDLVNEEAR